MRGRRCPPSLAGNTGYTMIRQSTLRPAQRIAGTQYSTMHEQCGFASCCGEADRSYVFDRSRDIGLQEGGVFGLLGKTGDRTVHPFLRAGSVYMIPRDWCALFGSSINPVRLAYAEKRTGRRAAQPGAHRFHRGRSRV